MKLRVCQPHNPHRDYGKLWIYEKHIIRHDVGKQKY